MCCRTRVGLGCRLGRTCDWPFSAASLVERYWSTGWCFWDACSSHTWSAGAEGSIRSGEVKIWKVYAKYNNEISVKYTHWQTDGHLLLAIHYLVRGVSNTCLTSSTGHVEIQIVQQRALLLVRVCARHCSLWTNFSKIRRSGIIFLKKVFLTWTRPRSWDRKGTCECAALFTANTDISGCLCLQEGQSKYNWARHTSVPVHTMKFPCEQNCRLYAHIFFLIPRTSKLATSGPVPRSSHSQLKLHRAIYTAELPSKFSQEVF